MSHLIGLDTSTSLVDGCDSATREKNESSQNLYILPRIFSERQITVGQLMTARNHDTLPKPELLLLPYKTTNNNNMPYLLCLNSSIVLYTTFFSLSYAIFWRLRMHCEAQRVQLVNQCKGPVTGSHLLDFLVNCCVVVVLIKQIQIDLKTAVTINWMTFIISPAPNAPAWVIHPNSKFSVPFIRG